MNNNPFEQPTNPASPPGQPPVNPTPPPATPAPTPPPANPFAVPNTPPPVQPKPESTQSVPVISRTGPGMPSKSQPNASGMYQAVGNEPPSKGKGLLILIISLVVILVLGGLFFASWEGWINLGGIEKYWTKEATTNTNSGTEGNTNSGTEGNTVNANDQQRKSDLTNIKTALAAYFQVNQNYPVAAVEEKTSDPKSALNVLIPTYLASLPVDPTSPVKYYAYKSDGKSYTLTAALEDTTDPLGIQVGGYYIYKVTNISVETPQATNSNSNSNSNSNTNSM